MQNNTTRNIIFYYYDAVGHNGTISTFDNGNKFTAKEHYIETNYTYTSTSPRRTEPR